VTSIQSLKTTAELSSTPACAALPLHRPPPGTSLPQQSKLFALAHAGLAFRFCRWQHTAALQTLLVALLASHTAWQDPCSQPELLAEHAHQRPTLRQAADTLTNMHWLPLQLLADPGSECNDSSSSSSSSSRYSVVHAAGGAKEAQLPFVPPLQTDACWLLLTWLQASLHCGHPCSACSGMRGAQAAARKG
jgi:hypothetical protein